MLLLENATPSIVLAQELNKESEVNISDRTVRVHTKKLGLATIAKSLPKLVATLKKLLSIAQAGVNGLQSSVSRSIPVHRSTNCRNIWRAQIIPLHNSGIKKPVIAKFTGCALSTVYRWTSRRVERSLDDKTRSGCPAIFTDKVQLSLIGFYCQTSPLPGCGRLN